MKKLLIFILLFSDAVNTKAGSSGEVIFDTSIRDVNRVILRVRDLEKKEREVGIALINAQLNLSDSKPILEKNIEQFKTEIQKIKNEHDRKYEKAEDLKPWQYKLDEAIDKKIFYEYQLQELQQHIDSLEELHQQVLEEKKSVATQYLQRLVKFAKSAKCKNELQAAMDADAVNITSTKLEALHYCASIPWDGPPLDLRELQIIAIPTEFGSKGVVVLTAEDEKAMEEKKLRIQRMMENQPPPPPKKPIISDVPSSEMQKIAPSLSDDLKGFLRWLKGNPPPKRTAVGAERG